MSATIDERVVEMRFDNKQFKEETKATMSALDRLKSALNLPGASKGLEQIDKASRNVKFDGIQAGLDALTKRFSVMGIVADQTIRNITNAMTGQLLKAINFVKEGIVSGGIRRAMNIENAHFQLQALLKDEEKVQVIMDNAMESVSDTAYGYDEAAKAASMFAASGIKGGEEMLNALMGVAGAAAMTNSEYEGISMIFTTVAGQGRIMADQLNQFAARGLNAAATIADYFNEVSAGGGKATESVRKAIKTMTAGKKTTEADIRELVSDGAISFEIFAQAMNDAFGESAKKANETFTGSFTNMKAALARIGAGFISPLVEQNGQLVKMFNALKDRVNDVKKTLVFDKELGNVNALSKQFTDSVIGISKSITDFLVNLDVTKPMQLFYYGVEIVKNSAKGLRTVLAPLTTSFKNVFLGFSIDDVIKIASSLENLTSKMKLSFKASSNLYDAFKGVFSIGKLLLDIFIGLLKAIIPINEPVFALGDGFLAIAGGLGRSLTKFSEWIRSSGKLEKGLGKIGNVVKDVTDFLTEMITGFGDFKEKVSEIPAVQKILVAFGLAWDSVSDSARSGLDSLRDGFSELKDWITESIPESATDTYGFLANKIEEIAEALAFLFGIARQNEGFDAFITNMSQFFKDAKANLGNGDLASRIENLRNVFGTFANFLKTYVAPILSSINLGAIITLLTGLGTIKSVSKLTKSLTSISDVAKSIGKGFAGTLGSVKKTLEAYQQDLKAEAIKKVATALLILAGALVVLSFCDTDRLMGAATALSLVAGTLVLAMEKFKAVKDDTKHLDVLAQGVSDGMRNLTSAVKWKAVGSTVKDFAKSVGIIAASILALGLMYKKDKKALDAGVDLVMDIGKILVSVTAGVAIISKVLGKEGTKGMRQAGSSVMLVSASLLVVVTALKSLFKMKIPEDWQLKVELLAGIFGGIVTLILALGLASKTAEGQKINGGPIITAAASMLLIVTALKSLFKIKLPKDWLAKVGILAGMFVALEGLIIAIGAASKIAGGKLKATGTILAMCVFIGTAVASLMVLSAFPADKLLKGATALGIILLGLAVSLAGAGKISKTDSYKSVLAMAVTVGAITASLAALTMIDAENLKKACAALGSMLLALALDFVAIGTISDENSWKTVAAMVAQVIAITVSLAVLSAQPWEGLLAAAGSLSSVLLALSGAFSIIGASKADNGKIASFLLATTSLLPIVASLYLLSKQPWQGLLSAGIALSEVLLAFSGTFAVINLAKPDVKAIGTFLLATLGIVPIAAALYTLSEQPWESLLAAGIALSEVLLAISAAMRVAALVGTTGRAALVGIGILDVFIANLALVLAALGGLTKIPGFTEIIQNGGEVLSAIGDALGSFVGNIVGGALGGISSGFVEVGKNLSRFSEEAQPFFDSMANVDPAVFKGIAALAEALLLLTAKGLLDGISELFGSKYTLSDFAVELKRFASPLKEYAEEVKGIDASSVEGSAAAIKILADAANSLSRTGGFIQTILGEKRTLSDFAAELKEFGPSLKEYVDTVQGINEGHVEGSAKAIQVLSEAASSLQSSGGLMQDIFGEKSLSKFAAELKEFAPSLIEYIDYVGDVTEADVQGSANAMTALIEASNNLEKTGGAAGLFGGNKDLAAFGEKLVAFGSSLYNYYESVAGIESYKLTGITTSTQKVIDMASSMKGIDFSSMGSFASNLKKMANNGLDDFILAFQNADGRVRTVINETIDAMIETLRSRAEEFKTQGNNVLAQFIVGLQGKKADVSSSTSGVFNEVISSMKKKEGEVKKEGGTYVEVFSDGMNSKKKTLAGTTEGLITNTLITLSKKNGDFQKQGKESMNSFVNGVQNASKTGFSKVESNMANVGKNIVGGLSKGLDAALPSLLQKTKNIASQIDATTRTTLEIRSPSRVAIETATFYSKGLAVGLAKSTPMVKDAAEKLADGLFEGFNGKTKKLNLLNSTNLRSSLSTGMVEVAKAMSDEVKFLFDVMNSSDIVDRVSLIAKEYERVSAKNENDAAMLAKKIEQYEADAQKAEQKAQEAQEKAEKAQDEADKKKDALEQAQATAKKKKAAAEEKEAILKEKQAALSKKKSDSTQKAAETAKKNAEKAEKEYEEAKKEVEKAEEELKKSKTALKKEEANYKAEMEEAEYQRKHAEEMLAEEQRRQNRQYMEYEYENGELKQSILVQEDVYWKKLLETKRQGNESAKYLDMSLLQFEEEVLQKTLGHLQQYSTELETTRDNLFNSMNLFSEVSFSDAVSKSDMIDNLSGQIEAMKEYDAIMQALGARLAGTNLGEYIQTLGIDALPQLREIMSMTEDELNLYTTLYDEKFNAANEYAKHHLQDLKSDVEKELGALFGVDPNSINLEDFTTVFDGTMASISKYLEKSTGEAGYSMKQFTVTAGLSLIEGVEEVKAQVEKAGDDVGKAHVKGIKNGMKDEKTMAKMVDKFLNKVGEKQTQSFSSGQQIGSKSVSGVKSKEGEMIQAGANVGQGYVNGVLSKLSAASNAGYQLGMATKAGTAQAMAIRSPSRVMQKLGNFSGLGFVNGLISFVSVAKKTGAEVGTSALKGVYESFQGAPSNLDPDLNLAIRPVVDLTNVRKSADEANRLFNEAVQVSASKATQAVQSAKIQQSSQRSAAEERRNVKTEKGSEATFQFVQNNYSPKALNRVEIYRQTRNQISQIKEVVKQND